MENLAALFILLFLAVTFLQSGYDKFTDWNSNVLWLKEHFANTFLANKVSFSLKILLLLEIIAGVLCVLGIIEMSISGGTVFGKYGASLSCVTLMLLLFGQRVAKDYDGARTIVIYFIPAVLAVFWLS
jgi:uncharacterized membrane protein YphA (DoxX/SURF4 family)